MEIKNKTQKKINLKKTINNGVVNTVVNTVDSSIDNTTILIEETLNTGINYTYEMNLIRNYLKLNGSSFIWKFKESEKSNCIAELNIISKLMFNKYNSSKDKNYIDINSIFNIISEKATIYFYEDDVFNMKIEIKCKRKVYTFYYQPIKESIKYFDKKDKVLKVDNLGLFPFLDAWKYNLENDCWSKGIIASYVSFNKKRYEELYAEFKFNT